MTRREAAKVLVPLFLGLWLLRNVPVLGVVIHILWYGYLAFLLIGFLMIVRLALQYRLYEFLARRERENLSRRFGER